MKQKHFLFTALAVFFVLQIVVLASCSGDSDSSDSGGSVANAVKLITYGVNVGGERTSLEFFDDGRFILTFPSDPDDEDAPITGTYSENATTNGSGKLTVQNGDGKMEMPFTVSGTKITLTMEEETIDLYKDFLMPELPKFKVTFDKNAPKNAQGEALAISGEMADEIFTQGVQHALTICTFTNADYGFVGWAKTKSATTATYTDGERIAITEDTTLYAVWEKFKAVQITFNANGGTPASKTQNAKVVSGKAITLERNTFSKSGYEFAGWRVKYSTENFSGYRIYLKNIPSSWTNRYIYYYNDAAGSGTTQQNHAWPGQAMTKAGDKAYFDITEAWAEGGKTLAIFYGGKSDGSDGTNRYPLDGEPGVILPKGCNEATFDVSQTSWEVLPDESSISSEIGDEITLYAVWGKECTVTFDKNDVDATGTMENQSFVSESQFKLNECTFEKEGYEFAGWATSDNKTKIAYSGDNDVVFDDNITLYVVWKEAPSYTITFHENSGLSFCEKTFQIKVPKSKGSTVTIKSETLNQKVQEAGFNKALGDFWGWAEDATASYARYDTEQDVTAYFYSTDTTDTKDFYAFWKDYYLISFQPNGGTGTQDNIEVHYDKTARGYSFTLPECTFTKENYFCYGWGTAPSVTLDYSVSQYLYDVGKKVNVYNNTATIYYAIWLPEKYTITYDSNGGSATTTNYVNVTRQNAKTKPTVTLNAQTPTKSGKAFYGWSITKRTSTPVAAGYSNTATYTVSKNLYEGGETLYALWLPETITLTYNNDKTSIPANVSTPTQTVNISPYIRNDSTGNYVEYAVPISSEKLVGSGSTALAFYGWSTSDMTEKVVNSLSVARTNYYAPGERVVVKGNTTLYAAFVQNSSDVVTVTFDKSGGKINGTAASVNCHYFKNQTCTFPEVTVEPGTFSTLLSSYDFVCWIPNATENLAQSTEPSPSTEAKNRNGYINGATVTGGFSANKTLYVLWWKH